MKTTLPQREEINFDDTWDIASILSVMDASRNEKQSKIDDWEQAFAKAETLIPQLSTFKGNVTQSAERLLNWLKTVEEILPIVQQVMLYAHLASDVDLGNQTYKALDGRGVGLAIRARAAMSFAEPELLTMSESLLARFMHEKPELKAYQHYFNNLFRQQAHVRSAEVEELLAKANEPFNAPASAYAVLANSDLKFGFAIGADGKEQEIGQSNINELLQSNDRELRRSTYQHYADAFLAMKNTSAAIYTGKVQKTVFISKARNYKNSLEMSLHANNVPVEVYHNVIDACNRNLPIWHRYWDLRRRALKLDKLQAFDIFAPLCEEVPVPYAQAVEWICAGMQPLGEEYTAIARAGLTHERWVDKYPNQGKRQGAYSSGVYGTKSFILMSYHPSNGLSSMSTLAHELGHSMHSTLSKKSQRFLLHRYSLFAAEVASNFNQALVRSYLQDLPEKKNDRTFQIALIEEAMRNFHRYLFLMPILSQWELWAHEQIEQRRSLTPVTMSEKLVSLFRNGYGPAWKMDEAREGIVWSQFNHLYSDFYVFQYASGIAAANALAAYILSVEGKEREIAVKNYLAFLNAGGAMYPLDALMMAGINMQSPEPMDRAFGVLEGFVNRLEELI
jgi:oligoendopeptidase F